MVTLLFHVKSNLWKIRGWFSKFLKKKSNLSPVNGCFHNITKRKKFFVSQSSLLKRFDFIPISHLHIQQPNPALSSKYQWFSCLDIVHQLNPCNVNVPLIIFNSGGIWTMIIVNATLQIWGQSGKKANLSLICLLFAYFMMLWIDLETNFALIFALTTCDQYGGMGKYFWILIDHQFICPSLVVGTTSSVLQAPSLKSYLGLFLSNFMP